MRKRRGASLAAGNSLQIGAGSRSITTVPAAMGENVQRPGATLKVLLIEDNPMDALLVREILGSQEGGSFQVHHADQLSTGLSLLDSMAFDAVLLDLMLPDSRGLDTFRTFHQHANHVPIIVMSGLDDETLAVQTVQEGAQDYLVKGTGGGALLVRAIRYAVERSRIRRDLDHERKLLHSLIEGLPEHVYVKDTDGHFLVVNPSSARFFGAASPEDVIGKTDYDFFPAEAAVSFQQEEQSLFRSGSAIVNREAQVVDQNGQTRWVVTSKVPLCDDDGKIIALVGINFDITRRKRNEQQLQALNQDLAQSQRELLKAMEELKVAQMQVVDMAKMESVGRLAAGVAHEVKNPLAIIQMGLDYLSGEGGPQDATTVVVIHDMSDAVRRADAIVRGLLDFSSVRQMDLQAEDVNEVVEKAVMLVRHDLRKSKVSVVSHLAKELPLVALDRPKMEQVLINLFVNASHAMSDGGTLTVSTSTHRVEQVVGDEGSRQADRIRAGDTVVVVDVEDTGPGIAADKLEKIFEPFFTTKATGVGTGLGLTVVRKIVERHGGTIEIRNRSEGGVRATVTLPAVRNILTEQSA